MENYSYNSYPESGDSSPRSREIDFENPSPWEDPQNPQNYKVKFMCSYNGKIHPRPHDNQLSYIGGDTKILAVDRNIKFASMISKLSSLCSDTEVTFKYQLPGEDLDALISVTNDDDLDHMMHEYDRLYRTLAKPARMRLFLFPVASTGSFGSDGSKSDRDRFVESLNSGPAHVSDSKKMAAAANHVDFLFGLEKGVPPHKIPDQVAPTPPEYHVPDDRVMVADRVVDPDHTVNPVEVQRHLQRLQIHEQQVQEAMYMRKSEENLAGIYPAGGDYYVPKMPEKAPPATLPASVPQTTTYWPEKQVPAPNYPPQVTTGPGQQEQQMYMFSAQGTTMYHAPGPSPQMIRPVSGQPGQPTYYQNVQRMAPGPDVYRDQPMYSMVQTQGPTMQAPPPLSAAQPLNLPSMGMVRSGGGVTDGGGYTQVAYDSASGRQVYYTAPGGMVVPQPQYQGQGMGMAVSGEMRGGGGGLNQEGKVVVTKGTQA